MKRFSKILVAVLALCLLVGALALAISANSGIEGNFVVQGEGYETWGEAVDAAKNTYTIYLNKNLEIAETIAISGADTKVKFDLNGKSLSQTDDINVLFRVSGGASLTITGSGTFDNVLTLVTATGSSKITLNATGSGIVINHKEVDTAKTVISTFRIYDNSGIDVFGAVTVNGINGSRYIFNLTKEGSTSPSATYLNIKDAKILAPLATAEKGDDGVLPAGYTRVISLNGTTAVTISNTDITAYYAQIFEISGDGTKNVSAYKNAAADFYTWKDGAAQGIVLDAPTITLVANNSRFYSDYGQYSVKMNSGSGGHNPGASIMFLDAKLDAKFDNCSFYADWRPFTSSGSITNNNINQHQLLFTNCHFDNSDGDNSTSQFFIYGMNYKILDSTFAHTSGISAGSNYYLPLVDADGKPTGKWIGGYMDNTLIDKERKLYHSNVDGGWVDSTYVEENSLKVADITRVCGNDVADVHTLLILWNEEVVH